MTAHALLQSYIASLYELRLPGGRTRAVLCIGEAVPSGVSDWLAAHPFGALITAYNPRSTPRAAIENRTAQHTLLQALREAGARWLPGVGRDLAGSWREPSLFVTGLDLAQIDALACRHSQNAVVLAHRQGCAELRSYLAA